MLGSTSNARRKLLSVVLDWLASPTSQAKGLTSGYSILLPTPQDMPFLLDLALKNLLSLDLSNCHAIYVIPDGRPGSPEILQQLVLASSDPRVHLVPLNAVQTAWVDKIPRRDGGANSRHWITIMAGLAKVATTHAFLHDVDAFLFDRRFIERQYRYATDHGCATLGVTRRWDPFLQQSEISLPATWELLFDVEWARSHRASAHKGGTRQVSSAAVTFDTMLWPQYCDFHSRKIGILPNVSSHDYVHFNGTITSFRTYHRMHTANTEDELFRLLLLALWENTIALPGVPRLLPTIVELAQGLNNPAARITYQGHMCRKGYAEFRHMVARLTECSAFGDSWRAQIEVELAEFDAHFSFDPDASYGAALEAGEMRVSGLQQSTSPPAVVAGR